MLTTAQCYICKRGPYLLQNLYAHMRNVHRCSEEKIEEAQRAIKKAIYKEELKCSVCEKYYFSSGGLRKHIRNAHRRGTVPTASNKSDRKTSLSVECPGCDGAFYSNMELALHCEKEHGNAYVDFSTIRMTFKSWEDFESWLAEMERRTYSKLVRRHKRKSSKGTIYMYLCQQARVDGGNIFSEEKKQNRRRKRVIRHCPCFAKVQETNDELIKVTACFGHYGHNVDPISVQSKKNKRVTWPANIAECTSEEELRSVGCAAELIDVENFCDDNFSKRVLPQDHDYIDECNPTEVRQRSETLQEELSELMRSLMDNNRLDLLQKLNNDLQIALQQVEREMTDQHFLGRTVIEVNAYEENV